MNPIDLSKFDGITPGPRIIVRPCHTTPPDEQGDLAVQCGKTLVAEFFRHRNQHGNSFGVFQDPTPDAESFRLLPDLIAEVKRLREAMAPFAKVADAYDGNNLDDEARKFWGKNLEHENARSPDRIELYNTRGGGRLITLQHCLDARALLPATKPTA